MSKKDKMQLIAIGVVVMLVLIVVGFNYRNDFLPKPDTNANDYSMLEKRPNTPVKIDESAFQRQDFRDLRIYGQNYDIVVPNTAGTDYQPPSTKKGVYTSDELEIGI